jgi:flagella basal body P-ring formation protein FlgA
MRSPVHIPARPAPWRWWPGCALLALGCCAQAQDAALDTQALSERISALAREGARLAVASPVRVAVEVGQLDPRLKLAPCQKVEPYLPSGLPAWGHTRVGLKCVQGAKLWNVSLPVVVHVWSRALVTTAALPAGTVLEAAHLGQAEVDLAGAPGAALNNQAALLGRTLARSVPEGQALHQNDLKARQWFAAGETVKLVATGPGWRIVTEGQAVSPGLEGQPARVRTENGRIVQGRPVGDREVEMAL